MIRRKSLLSLICATMFFLAVETTINTTSPIINQGVVKAATYDVSRKITQGALQAIGRDGQPRADCPLEHTGVKADVSGSLARVTFTQRFRNPLQEKIEAVYVEE